MEFGKLMKLKILEKISAELSSHIDNEVDRLLLEREKDYDVNKIISFYSEEMNIPLSIFTSKKVVNEVVNAKREVSFIFYMLNCPFYKGYGINEIMKKEKVNQICNALNITKVQLQDYICSAKHFYKFYSDFNRKIDNFLNKNISHFYK